MRRFNRLLLAGSPPPRRRSPVAQAGPPPPTVPTEVQVPPGNKVFLLGHAVGVQIYSCNGVVWGSVAPRANLYDDTGKLIITHFGGPTWQAKDAVAEVPYAADYYFWKHPAADPTPVPAPAGRGKPQPGGPNNRRVVECDECDRR